MCYAALLDKQEIWCCVQLSVAKIKLKSSFVHRLLTTFVLIYVSNNRPLSFITRIRLIGCST